MMVPNQKNNYSTKTRILTNQYIYYNTGSRRKPYELTIRRVFGNSFTLLEEYVQISNFLKEIRLPL